jgi:hypothetical protein
MGLLDEADKIGSVVGAAAAVLALAITWAEFRRRRLTPEKPGVPPGKRLTTDQRKREAARLRYERKLARQRSGDYHPYQTFFWGLIAFLLIFFGVAVVVNWLSIVIFNYNFLINLLNYLWH